MVSPYNTVLLSHIVSTVSDGVSPSPKVGAEPARPPLNPPLGSVVKFALNFREIYRENFTMFFDLVR